MRSAAQMQKFLLLLCAARGIDAFVYSCEEVKYQLINKLKLFDTTYACVVVQEDFTNWGQLGKISAVRDGETYNFTIINGGTSSCTSTMSDNPWRVTAPTSLDLDCTQEFTVIFTSDMSAVYTPLKEVTAFTVQNEALTLAVPQTGMWIKLKKCTGVGVVTLYTGAGVNEKEERYILGNWKCGSVPKWIISFDDVITISSDVSAMSEIEFSSALTPDAKLTVANNDRIVIFTNGKADDLQNLKGIEHRACFHLANAIPLPVTVNMELTFDSSNTGAVVLQKMYHGSDYSFITGTYTEQFITDYFEVQYAPSGKQASDIGKSQDNIFIDITIGSDAPLLTTTPTPTTSTPKPSTAQDPYCNCAVDKFGFSNGWNSNDIWLDIVVILDTSEAMGAEALEDARELIESFISDGEVDFLITDSTAPFYTRVGVISMAEAAEVLFNLNMTKADKVLASIKKGLTEININQAFEAATIMLSEGLKSKPDRANTRQVIYFMTDSEPKTTQDALNKFKEAGVMIVNNFLKEGETECAGLKQLASDGYYYSTNNYLKELQVFCKANCFCRSEKSAYVGTDPATNAAGGCYHPVTAGVPFNKAKTACSDGGGIIATVHDEKKGQFVQQLISKAKFDYFWIGYEKSNEGVWQWEDKSTDPYTNWDVNEPSSAAVSKCAYVDKTNSKLPWGAGNCQLGFPYVCQYAPCSVGSKNC